MRSRCGADGKSCGAWPRSPHAARAGGRRSSRPGSRAGGVRVRPVLGRPADDAAVLVPGRRAFGLAEEDETSGEGAGVAGSVADHHPAHRLGGLAEGLRAFCLPGVLPQELGVEAVVGPPNSNRTGSTRAQPSSMCSCGPHHESVGEVAATARLACSSASRMPEAKPMRVRMRRACSRPTDSISPQLGHRAGVQQQHAVLAEPDEAVLRGEAQQAAQVGVLRYWMLAKGLLQAGFASALRRLVSGIVVVAGRSSRLPHAAALRVAREFQRFSGKSRENKWAVRRSRPSPSRRSCRSSIRVGAGVITTRGGCASPGECCAGQ